MTPEKTEKPVRWEVRCYMVKGRGPSHVTKHDTSEAAHAYKARMSSQPKAFGAVFKYQVVRITTTKVVKP